MEYIQTQKEDWEVNIRTDMWNDMNVSQLCVQQSLVVDKINLLNQIQITPTVLQLRNALATAMSDLDQLITRQQSTNRQ